MTGMTDAYSRFTQTIANRTGMDPNAVSSSLRRQSPDTAASTTIDRPVFMGFDKRLEPIAAKVAAGERLSLEDGLLLYETPDLLTVGALANQVREHRWGDKTFYNLNMHINPTNVCWVDCGLCAFGKFKGTPGTYAMTPEQVLEMVNPEVDEVHMVAGLHPNLPYEWYLDVMRVIKEAYPHIHVKGWTAVEIDFMQRLSKKPLPEIFEEMREAGLGSMPGGGAEIFHPEVRAIICKHKISGDRWLKIHRVAHECGFRSNATMLYGHVERPEHKVDHLMRLRDLQDQTGGFQCLIPLHFHPENTALQQVTEASGMDDLREIAVSRLLLDNFDHIKAYWIMLTPKLAQVALWWGADDMDGTVVQEKIVHDANCASPRGLLQSDITTAIREAGRVPVLRDTLYRELPDRTASLAAAE
ncbi:MAG: Aminodeoxyfutalosine synthase [bacterium]|nr:Aminodeoxyfutalosine synthase [bacterium]